MTIFVHHDEPYPDKWHLRFLHILSEHYKLRTRLVDFLNVPLTELAPQVRRDDGVVGRWGYRVADRTAFRSMIDTVTTMFGGRVFPTPHSYSFYHDKAKQASLFLTRGYPTPSTAVVNSLVELESFLARESLSLPVVTKTFAGGAGAGVRLLGRLSDARFPCIAQQFCPGNAYDYRVCVIGHRVMGYLRRNPKNDFRASASGDHVYVSDIPAEVVGLAARISGDNAFESMCYDIIRLGTRWVVLEMSYAYVDESIRECSYYYDTRSGARVLKPGLYPQDFIVADFLSKHYPDVMRSRGSIAQVS